MLPPKLYLRPHAQGLWATGVLLGMLAPWSTLPCLLQVACAFCTPVLISDFGGEYLGCHFLTLPSCSPEDQPSGPSPATLAVGFTEPEGVRSYRAYLMVFQEEVDKGMGLWKLIDPLLSAPGMSPLSSCHPRGLCVCGRVFLRVWRMPQEWGLWG